MMDVDKYSFVAPSLTQSSCNQAEMLGAMAWLWLHAEGHRDLPIHALARFALPPVTRGQFILMTDRSEDAHRPVALLTWAWLNADAERRYMNDPVHGLQPEDWNSGDRPWMIDWFAPFGHSHRLARYARRTFKGMNFRALYHRGNERGFKVLTFRGLGVDRRQAARWWHDRPMLA